MCFVFRLGGTLHQWWFLQFDIPLSDLSVLLFSSVSYEVVEMRKNFSFAGTSGSDLGKCPLSVLAGWHVHFLRENQTLESGCGPERGGALCYLVPCVHIGAPRRWRHFHEGSGSRLGLRKPAPSGTPPPVVNSVLAKLRPLSWLETLGGKMWSFQLSQFLFSCQRTNPGKWKATNTTVYYTV